MGEREATMPNRHFAMLRSRGFDAGNFANAYVSEDYETAFAKDTGPKEHEAYCVGFILGFFGSYELYEIPSDCLDMYMAAYFSEDGKAVVEAGYIDPRTEEDWNEVYC
jgi:hypothetical protein